MTLKIAILGSTRGSNLEPLFKQIQTENLAAEIVLVLSDREDALILIRAQTLGLTPLYLPATGLTRAEYGEKLNTVLKSHEIDLVLLVGFMRILAGDFTQKWSGKILNVHPSLLPKHAGLMDLQVHAAAIEAKDLESGCTVHAVEEIVDAGKVIVQKRCTIAPNETPASLKVKVQALEVPALVEAIKRFI